MLSKLVWTTALIGVDYRAKVRGSAARMPIKVRLRRAGLIWINAHPGGKMVRTAGLITHCAALAVLVAYASPGFAQGTR
jgi:proteasome assembly chaperone (PAC2) family protein